MRKILFRVLIVVLLVLLFVLWVAFYQDKTPLHVLQGWFGVSNEVVVTDALQDTTTPEQKKEHTEAIKDIVNNETSNSWDSQDEKDTVVPSTVLTESEKEDTKKLVDSLFKK